MMQLKRVAQLIAGVGTLLVLAAFAWNGNPPPKKHVASAPSATRALVLRGRQVVIEHDCAGCHGGIDPNDKWWLAGVHSPQQEFPIGPCGKLFAAMQGKDPNSVPADQAACFTTRPKNLTPDNLTGTGRFTERQIFNALKYGLRPEDTPDMVITSNVPGKGNFPMNPKYLAPPMPWNAWRHIPDADLWAIAAYIKHGLKPMSNKVQDSEGPPDFWASEYTVEKIGTAKSPAFPTAYEQDVGSGKVTKK